MILISDLKLHSHADLTGVAFPVLRHALLREADAHSLDVVRNTDVAVTCMTRFGTVGAEIRPVGARVTVRAAKSDRLHMLKESLVEHLVQLIPEAVEQMRWSDAKQPGGIPANFHFGRIENITPLGTSFLRMRLASDGLGSFTDDAIHFRLVLPPAHVDTVDWPYVSENGTTVWPKGERALHRPVYTTRFIDHAVGVMDCDVFLHDGGRTTAWAQSAAVGDRVAFIGPGGGGIPKVKAINMYGDETAFPAIARILETLPSNTVGDVVISASGGALRDYHFDAPDGMRLTTIMQGHDLAQLALSGLTAHPDRFLWFAAEKSLVQPVRDAVKSANITKQQTYIAAYWSK
ncbi:siderophore-interacting protein [Actibacterium sp. 188UL27-1]|uniref:siderophore-interacting protein n=1 Tax=Actibacterium sp. 188UL27-1 TaxID=2786961 RepID=UPI001958D142|nr:siderophore-interacting protein [Actibacterium sp. 188UL27-1]MBM7069733.1 siderophore-interacting protein [Actibacterium sp. 188UL27-1]